MGACNALQTAMLPSLLFACVRQDHGQLPPVKDCKMYDWKGVRFTDPAKGVKYLDSAPLWERAGVKAYDEITERGFVFFLDSIERSKDPTFQRFQLRARDGALTLADAQYIREHMDASKRGADFNGPEVYRLVPTRRERDECNAEQLDRAIDEGHPSIILEAINSSSTAAEVDDDDVRLHNDLVLTIGARVMILHNLCVAHGLVNGTTGFVHDVIVDANNKAVAVLIVVKRRTGTSDGYSGPSFLEHAEGVNMETHAVVSIGLHTIDIYDSNASHTRTQFPIMLVRR